MITPKDFFDEIFGGLRANEQIYVWSKDPHKRFLVDKPEEVLAIANDSRYRGSDLYFGVGLRVRGSFDDISRSTVAWADADAKDYGGEEAALEAIHSFALEPSFIVSSGHGYHAYWLLENGVNPRRISDVCRAIQETIKSDVVNDAQRVLRVPGTVNYKDRDAPKPVMLVYENGQRRYAADDVVALGHLRPQTATRIVTGSTRGYKSRSERDWAVIRELVGTGVSLEAIKAIAEDREIGDRWREDNFRLLEQDYNSAKKGFSPAVAAFEETDSGTFYTTQKGLISVATFCYDPTKLLQANGSGGEDVLLGTIHAFGKSWPDIAIPRSSFSSESAFHKNLTSAYWQWFGNNQQTRQYLVYVMAKLAANGMPTSNAVSVVGRHNDYWVTRTQTLSVDRVFSTDDAPYIYIGDGTAQSRTEATTVVPATSYTDTTDEDYRTLVGKIRYLLPQINEPAAILPLLGWMAATPLKPLLISAGFRFPILNVFGTMGSGKTTTLEKVLLPLLGVIDPVTNTASTTDFVLRKLFSSTNAIPVIFGEYRASTTATAQNDFYQLLRMAYDSGMDSRGRKDLTTVTYRLDAPIVIDGEDPLTDPALRQRSVLVNMKPRAVIEGTPYYAAFKRISAVPLTSFAKRYIQRTLSETVGSTKRRMDAALDISRTICPGFIPDRIRNNLATVILGLELFNEHLLAWGQKKLAWTAQAFSPMLGNVMLNLANGSQRVLADDFVEDSVGYVANPTQSRIPFIYSYDIETTVLWIHLRTAAAWWAKDRRHQGKGSLEVASLRTQLAEKAADPDVPYILSERTITTKGGRRMNCFGVDLAKAHIAGLSVPDSLDTHSVNVRQGFRVVSVVEEETTP